jgi:uncharacterized NAD-dependent epimerase/dehydratase family protein
MKPKAMILTNGLLTSTDAKTAHGLIRFTERYQIAAVIDPPTAGRDAGEVLDGKKRNIPVYATVEEALDTETDIQYLIIGVATVGGILPANMIPVIETAIRNSVSVVNGLHDYLNDKPSLLQLAAKNHVHLIDIRKPKSREQLHFWTGEIFDVTAPVIAVLGMDCAMGKRTTARMICNALQEQGSNAQMIYTGQTGWLQGGRYGFIFDSTLNDFIAGELEHAIVTCWKETQAAFILLEGQSSLRNPSGPCGLEFLISGNAKKVVLVFSPKRKYFDDDPHWGEMPTVASEIDIISKFGATVIAVAINTRGCTKEEALAYQKEYECKLNIPVLLPVEEGVDKILPIIKSFQPASA